MQGTVVIADDSPTLRRIVSSVLQAEGYDVLQAEDGVTAIQSVFRSQPDAVVLDVQMPRVSGYVACRLLKDDWQTQDIPIIMLTSLEAASDRYWGRKTGADGYLTKDFEAPELVRAVRIAMEGMAAMRGSHRRMKPDPVELSADDVLAKVCDLLDRKLFETSVAAEVTELAATAHGFEATVAQLLEVVSRFVDYHLACVMLLEEKLALVSVKHEAGQTHFADFLAHAAEAVSLLSGSQFAVSDVDARVGDPGSLLGSGDDDGPMATFLSMPLHGFGGRILGVMALSSSNKSAFSEAALSTLKLVEGPAAIVIDNARLSVTHS